MKARSSKGKQRGNPFQPKGRVSHVTRTGTHATGTRSKGKLQLSVVLQNLVSSAFQKERLADLVEERLADRSLNRIRAGEELALPEKVVTLIILQEEPPLKVFREWRKLGRKELSKKARISYERIVALEESGEVPRRDERIALSRALNIPADLLEP